MLGERQGASGELKTNGAVPPAAASPGVLGGDTGLGALERQTMNARGGGGLTSGGNQRPVAPAATIDALRELQRQRRFCIKSQSRTDRSCEAFVARFLGYHTGLPDAERKALWLQAAAMRRSVEKGGGGHPCRGNQPPSALAVCSPIILNSATARQVWDAHRKHVEAEMRKLARSLPAWAWVATVPGFAELGLAIIAGEAGDLANYATKERLWKRLGLAVIDGERQQRKAGAEAAAAHGYSPQRRAEGWAIADSMFKHQWAGASDDAPARPKGAYGHAYAARKARTEGREGWTPAHRDADARRIMFKALVEDLWRVWRGLPALALAWPLNRH